MKKLLALLLVFVLSLSALSVSAEALAGGWTMLDVTASIPEEALAAFDKAMATLVGVSYEPAALLSTQLVAGTNYLFLCKAAPVVPDAVSYWATVTVYAALDGSAEVLSITAIDPYPPVED